jgi:PAS domain S-box-containing protein
MSNASGKPVIDFRVIVEAAPLPIFIFDLETRVHLWNAEAERLFLWRVNEVLGRPLPIVPPEVAEEFDAYRHQLLIAGTHESFETVRMRKDGERVRVVIHPRLMTDASGEPWAVLVIVRDVTERHALESRRAAAEEQLGASEERFRRLLDRFPGVMWTCDRELRITSLDGGGVVRRGMSAEQLVGRTLIENTHADHPMVHAVRNALQGTLGVLHAEEYEGARYDTYLEPLRSASGEIEGVLGITLDVTEVQEARDEVQISREELHRLSNRILQVQEEQRARISRELHDDLGQKLTALQFDLAHLERTTTSSAAVTEKLRRMSLLLDETLQSVRDIARELRPAILDHFGAAAAMENELHEFEERTGIHWSLTIDPPDLAVTGDAATALYRMLQEALTNTARHASATAVEVEFRIGGEVLEWIFRDNGVGFPVQRQARRGLGLAGIRERAGALGGTLVVSSGADGRGAELHVTLPLSAIHGRAASK